MLEQSALQLDQNLPTAGAPVRRLSGAWLTTARVAWVVLALTAVAILATALPGYARTFSGELAHISAQNQNTVTAVLALLSGLASLASALLALALASLFFWRRFTETVAAVLAFYLLAYAVVMSGPLEVWSEYWLGDVMPAQRLQAVLLGLPTVLLLAIFPNGRFVPAWSRRLPLLAIPWAVGIFFVPPFDAPSATPVAAIFSALAGVGLLGLFVAGVVAQLIRYRRASSPVEQQQLKWVIFGFALWLSYIVISTGPYFYLSNLPADAPAPWWGSLSVLGWFLALNIVPVSLTIAVTRYRLWNIDILINRTLVYGVLTAAILGLYALIVGAMGALFQAQTSRLIAFVAAAVVAVLFHPLRDRLQRRVNRLLYGHRDEPFEVLARLGQRLEDTLAPEQVLPTLLETIVQALKLPYAAIVLQQGDALRTAASYGAPVATPRQYPLIYQGSVVGRLLIAPRSPDERFTPAEERLLENIARQAGSAVHALQLTADLQHARRQIVSSREEERRRLRRDLHDGLGPSLAAQLLKIGSARALLATRPQASEQLLAEMETDIAGTLDDLRRIVYALRPPALDQWGLVGALRAFGETCESATLVVYVDAPEALPPLPAAVEVAAYHIAREALTNVVRHARAHHCSVTLWVEGEAQRRLHLVIRDDGQGLAGHTPTGVGLNAMRERAAELGGMCTIVGAPGRGATVTAVLPIEPA